jgi:hypothetical protein
MRPDSDLLKPSLSPGRDMPAAIYSVRAAALTSFFGGPIASALLTLINAHRLQRLARDWPLALLAVAAVVALHWSLSWHALGWLDRMLEGQTGPVLRRVAGLAFFGLGYALHATYYRSQSLLDLPTPDGTTIGILCILAGIGGEIGLTWLIGLLSS